MSEMEREVEEALEEVEVEGASPAERTLAGEVVKGVVGKAVRPLTDQTLTDDYEDEPPSPRLRSPGGDCTALDTSAAAGPQRRLTPKELSARRRNAQRAGVRSAEGKARSRLNARKHGVFASALTPLDRKELRPIHEEFRETAEPVGALEEALVEKMALCYLRIQRCARAEAELHRDVWEPTLQELWDRRDGRQKPYRRPVAGGRAAFFKPHVFERLVNLVHRYDTSLTNQFVRLMHELERLQRRRSGDAVEPPVSADVSVTGT